MKKTKSLDNTEYELDELFNFEEHFKDVDNIHNPEQIVASFSSFGINTKLCIEYGKGSNLFYITEIDDKPNLKLIKVIDIKESDDEIVIKCERQKPDKENKIKFVNGIIKEIDFRQGVCNEIFVKMLCNVFTEERLKEVLECDNIDVLLFEGLMYLRVKDRAYRL